MPHLYLIRGLPGSGKTTLAKLMLHSGMVDRIYAADDYFYRDVPGGKEYVFAPEFLADAHKQCLDRTRQALFEWKMSVAVHNTFSRVWEMEPYFAIRTSPVRCDITIITCEGDYGSIHAPPEVRERMAKRWEAYTE